MTWRTQRARLLLVASGKIRTRSSSRRTRRRTFRMRFRPRNRSRTSSLRIRSSKSSIPTATSGSSSGRSTPNPDCDWDCPRTSTSFHSQRAGGQLDGNSNGRGIDAAYERPNSERHADGELRPCPRCGMKLWPTAKVRPMRFHDLRHSVVTLLLRERVDAHRVQRLLRHRDVKTTTGTYGHLVVEDLREAINLLPPAPFAASLLQDPRSTPARVHNSTIGNEENQQLRL